MRERRTLASQAGLFSYNVHMTSQEFWRGVGRFLRDQREARPLTVSQLAAAAGLDPDTVKAIERGQPGRIDKLDRLLETLGFSIVDVLHVVLPSAESPPTPEAAALHRAFEQLGVEDRGLLLSVVRRLVALDEALGPGVAQTLPAKKGRARKGPPPR
jgi:transcriptional regulator with XRE-family HTH domain